MISNGLNVNMINNLKSQYIDDNGIATVETSILLPLILIIIALFYETLRFQNDISVIYYNEELATRRVDLALLKDDIFKISNKFLVDLSGDDEQFHFSQLTYSKLTMKCFDNIDLKANIKCGSKAKIINFSYQVSREYTNDFINKILSFPTNINREVFIVNDYYN